jgi:hypothetical protein
MLLDEGQEKAIPESILVIGEERFGTDEEGVRGQLATVQEILEDS